MKIWTLMLKDKPVTRFVVHEGEPIIIGRTDEADVTIDNPSISRIHAAIELEKGRDYITDKGSTNGTWVNGRKIKGRTCIRKKDKVKIGKFDMVAGAVGIKLSSEQSQSISMGTITNTIYAPTKK